MKIAAARTEDTSTLLRAEWTGAETEHRRTWLAADRIQNRTGIQKNQHTKKICEHLKTTQNIFFHRNQTEIHTIMNVIVLPFSFNY
jgi:hypothetical protein